MIHLTLTGVHAGTAGCMAHLPLPKWGGLPLPEGDTGAHYAYAPGGFIDGSDPRVCQACVRVFETA